MAHRRASGVFAELQGALNTIWEVQPRPGRLADNAVPLTAAARARQGIPNSNTAARPAPAGH